MRLLKNQLFRNLFFLILFIISAIGSNAQSWQWAQRVGANKSDKVTCVKTDSAGFLYTAGYFSNIITLGTNNLQLNYTSNTNSKEIFIAKYDNLGYCYWAKSGGEVFDDRVSGMDVDDVGNTVATGTFWETGGIDIGGNIITGNAFGGGDQCFIVKHDKNGTYKWGKFVCSNGGDDQGLDVAMDKFGNTYVVGFMGGNTLYCGGNTITVPNAGGSYTVHPYWLTKLDSNGNFKWAKTFGNLPFDASVGKYIERDIAVCVDNKGDVYVNGGFDGTHLFGNTTLTSTGGYDIFTMKYDSAGNFKWATSGGSRKDDWSQGISHDGNGHVYITGEHRDSLIYDTVIVKNYDARDVFVLKLDDQTGKPYWGARAGSNGGGERGNDIYADENCNVYVAGDINGVAKFGDNITTAGGNSVQSFVAKISPGGKWTWVATGGGTDSNDRGNAIALGKNAQLYAGGFFRSPATFGAYGPLTSAGSSDGFLARLVDESFNKNYDFKLNKPADSIICAGFVASVILPTHSSYKISPDSNATFIASNNELILKPIVNTTYTLTGIGNGICPSFDTITFTITIAPDPVASFVTDPPLVLLQNPVLNLINSSTGATSYEWSINNTPFSTDSNVTITPTTEGVYCYTLKATSIDGCIDTVTHCASVVFLESVFFPNSFTPDGNGINDKFTPILQNVDKNNIQNYKFIIANRLGQIVFETTDPNAGWDGKLNNSGAVMPSDLYFYHCSFGSTQVKNNLFQGDVLLLR
jgi:gliding motility-associated-like protein